jgi:hypothetical protein
MSVELWGPQPGFPNGLPVEEDNPDPTRNIGTVTEQITDLDPTPGRGCSRCCDFEDRLLASFDAESTRVPPYVPYPGPNSNTFAKRVIKGARGLAEPPNNAYGYNFE